MNSYSRPQHTIPLNRLRHGFPDELSFYTAIVNCIGDELMLIDSEARIVFVNDATVRGLGYSREHLLTRCLLEFFRQKINLADWKQKHFTELQRQRRPISYQIERIVAGGEIQTIAVTAVYMTYQAQGYILSIARDITQQIAIQRSLKESEDLYRLLSEGAGDGILTVDPEGRISYANPALEQMVRIPLKESKGKLFLKYIEQKSIPKAIACLQKAKQGLSKISEEIEILDRNRQSIPVEINVSPLYKGDKIVRIQAIIRDIRRRKQLEQLIMESEKMKSIQFFVSGTAEEIKHPLQVVVNRLQGMVRKYKERQFEYIGYKEFHDLLLTLEQIANQVKHCFVTTERLVELNRKKSKLQKRHCHANMALRELVQLKDNDFKMNNIHYHLALNDRIPLVGIGDIEFNQVIGNIVNNAIQAMPGGGKLTIRTNYLKAEDRVLIQIVDNGVGISEENLPHIFEPFFTTRQRGVEKSSGLGLPIAYSLVKDSQGQIVVKSSLRKGTMVNIFIPPAKKSRA
jgi:PAS domain S-box-containing protein